MKMPIEAEIYWLAWTCVLTGLLWAPYILNQLSVMGPWRAVSNSDPNAVERAGWAVRASAAHRNAVENLVVFAPLALGVGLTGAGSEATAAACLAYFWIRAGHYLVYLLAIPVLRTVLFALGVVCQAILAGRLLGWW